LLEVRYNEARRDLWGMEHEMTQGYAYDHAWAMERVRLAGLEVALDPGTREHLTRLGAGPGKRCLEVGAGGGSVAFWLSERVAPGGTVVATDLETDYLESEAAGHPGLEVLRHDITAEELPTGFDLVHARWLVEWLSDKRLALQRMVSALRPGGVLLIEEPDFVTIYGAAEPPELRRVVVAAMAHLTSISPGGSGVRPAGDGGPGRGGTGRGAGRGTVPHRPRREPARGGLPAADDRETA
jgi:SAM-dependent methyltransferase